MLVSKIKPCMSKYCRIKETANGSLNQYGSWIVPYTLDNCGNSRANTCRELRPSGTSAFIRPKPIGPHRTLCDLYNFGAIARARPGDVFVVCLINCHAPTMVVTVTGIRVRFREEPEKRLPHPRKAAGAQITHSQNGEVVTKNNNTDSLRPQLNEYTLNPLTRIH
ncbi:hypothetical protein AVEN_155533-1 [Araneus ventricosus]|uniref:Uncharacterized protein n=1 Tax=Araneus ventricosus TaxID=182803 RepID=A0A4Y2SIK0_ARAVE|nr:hypothetical protein AVEN_155533-1 [Araneus ventricosus]